MLRLYSASGTSDFTLSSGMPDEDAEELLFNASQLLAMRGQNEAAGLLATIKFEIREGTNHFGDSFDVLHGEIPLAQYEYLREKIEEGSPTSEKHKEYFAQIASVISELGTKFSSSHEFYIRHIVCSLDTTKPPDNWRSDLSNSIAALNSNQALFTFKDSRRLSHHGLNFRSKTEIKVFEALLRRGVLICPLPLVVMGKSRAYKEPDFLVCYDGKTGILEIHGDKWHPPETAAKEHDRRREFTKLGISIYEIFGADRCWDDPDTVVDEFLGLFKR